MTQAIKAGIIYAIALTSSGWAASAQECVDIEQVNVSGFTLLDPDDVNAIVGKKLGCLSLDDIDVILRGLTEAYFEEGYIAARAYLGEQDLSDKVLEITVVEGRVSEVVVAVNGQLKPKKATTAFPGVIGLPAKLDVIEQGLDQINRLPSQAAATRLEPGEEAGDTILLVDTRAQKPWRASLSFDNRGTSTSGTKGAGLSISYDDLFGVNDQLTFSAKRNADDFPLGFDGANPRSNSVSVGGSLPYGSWTFGFSGSASSYSTELAGTLTTIETTGSSRSVNLFADKVLKRDQDSKTKLNFGFTWKENENFIQGTLIDVGSRKLSFLDAGITHSWKGLGGSFDASFSIRQGIPFGRAFDDKNAPAGSPKGQFRSFLISSSFQRGWQQEGGSLVLSSSISGQFSSDLLFGSEQFSVGGFSSVRGSRQGKLFGNNGIELKNTLTWFSQPTASGVTFTPYLGIDLGMVQSQKKFSIDGGSIYGATIGIGIRKDNSVFDISASKSTNSNTGSNGDETILTGSLAHQF